MLPSRSFITTITALVAACALPASAAAIPDARSPDARDAAAHVGVYAGDASGLQAQQGPRSPDARDAAAHTGVYSSAGSAAQAGPGPRSPDARDAAARIGVYSGDELPTPSPVVPVTVARPSGGFDWGDAGIGAALTLALVCIAIGGMLIAGTRRRRGVRAVAS